MRQSPPPGRPAQQYGVECATGGRPAAHSPAARPQRTARPPRYVDALESLAILRELRGDPAGAIAAREEQLELYRTEWSFTEGETADSVRRDIARLREQL